MPVTQFIPATSRSAPAPEPEPTPDPDALTAAELAAVLDVEEDVASRLLSVTVELVERFAPDAPLSVRSEAIIRCSGWLYESPASGARMERTGEIATSFMPAATGALRASGAMSLLSPWKVRRAGVLA